MSVETIGELSEETAAVIETLNAELRTAQAFYDADLQAHANNTRREALVTSARTRATAAIESITGRAESTAASAAKKLAGLRPKIEDSPAALIKAQQAWDYDVRPLLEAGASIKTFLRDAGMDELLAIERFGVGYLRAAKLAAGPDNPLELDPEELSAAVNNRLAMVLPEDQRAGFEDGVRTADAVVKLREIHEVARDTISGRRPVGDTEGYARARTLAVKLRG